MIPAAPIRGPIQLPAPPAPKTTYKTYSSCSPSPSEVSYYRTFYSKIHGWTHAVRPPSTNLAGRSAIWSEPEVGGSKQREESHLRGMGSPTPSNPHPLPLPVSAPAPAPAPAPVPVPTPAPASSPLKLSATSRPLAKASQLPQRLPSIRKPEPVVAAGPKEHLVVPKYRPNATPHPSRPVSHDSSQSSQPSQRVIRDAYLAEALATPDLEIMTPAAHVETLAASRKSAKHAGSASKGMSTAKKDSVVRSVSASAHVASDQSRGQHVPRMELRTPSSNRQTGDVVRSKTVSGRIQGEPNSIPQVSEPILLQSRRTTAAASLQKYGPSLTLPVNIPLPSSVPPLHSQHWKKSLEVASPERFRPNDQLVAARQPVPSEQLTWRQAAAKALPPSIDTGSSKSLFRAQEIEASPRPASSVRLQHLEPHLLPLPSSRPTLRTQPSNSSLFPGSALGGRSLGRKHRDQSSGTLQARFEPAIYPLPPSASTANTALPAAHDAGRSPVTEVRGAGRLLASSVGQLHESAPPFLRSNEEVDAQPPSTSYPPRHVKVATDDHFSFDVPSGDRRRLHISLAWLKDGTATPRTRASEIERGPPVPSKSPQWHRPELPMDPPHVPLPILNSQLRNIPQPMAPYPQPYPQPGSRPFGDRQFHLSGEQRPSSPPAPFPPPQRNRGPYPESLDSFLSEPRPYEDEARKPGPFMYPGPLPLPTNYPAQRMWQPDLEFERQGTHFTGVPPINPDDSVSRANRGYRQQGYRNRSDSVESDEPPKMRPSPISRGLWEKVKGFTQRTGPPAASRWSRNEAMQVGGHSQPLPSGLFQRDRIDWSRSRVNATHIARLEQREKEDRLRAERDELRLKAAEWRRKERRARRAEEKARRAEDKRVRRLQREQAQRGARGPFSGFAARTDGRFARPDTERRQISQTSRKEAQSRAVSHKTDVADAEQPKIPKLPWRERLKQTRQPANYYRPRAGQTPSAPAPSHHYAATQGPGASHVARWRQAQSKLSRSKPAERANDVPRKQVNGWRIRWIMEKWFEG